MLRTHCQTSGWSLTAQDVFNNVGRTHIEAMAAVDGGTQSLHTNSLDEALALPTDFSARIARNTQIFLQTEGQHHSQIDPWGGSYYVERLTHDLAAQAMSHIEEVENLGGMASAIEAGIPKLRIEESAARIQARIDSGAQTVVGVNKYLSEEKDDIPILKVDNAAVRQGQIARLKQLRTERDTQATMDALDSLTKCADTGVGNLLALAVEAARKKATVGEISDALEKVYGRFSAKPAGVTGVYSTDVDVIAASSLAAGHLSLVPSLRDALINKGQEDILIVVGGVIPPEDIETLKEMGAKAVFPPGTHIPNAVLEVLDIVNMRLSQGG